VRLRVSKLRLTGSNLRAEGVIEIGACAGTNILYVKTTRRFCLFYADQVANYVPKLSPWGLRWAQDLLDRGHTPLDVSQRLGLTSQHIHTLTQQLAGAGYEKSLPTQIKPTDETIAKKQSRFMRRGTKKWIGTRVD
jgi:hypothetical protein